MTSQSFSVETALDIEKGDPQYAGTLLYLAYGKGQHIKEAVFSLLTAAHFEPFGTGRVRYVVYTDHPETFAALEGVTVLRIDKAKLDAWLEGSDYTHRRKLMVIIEALEKYRGKLAFVDTDTCFQRSPMLLFNRIGSGRSCLHVAEKNLRLASDRITRKTRDGIRNHPFTWSDGTKAVLRNHSKMWNSGITGFHYSDIGVLHESLRLCDHLWQQTRVHTCEQLAVGMAAERTTRIFSAWDVVFHYWHKTLKLSFQDRLESLLPPILALQPHLRPKAAYDARLKVTPVQWLRQKAKYLVVHVGQPAYASLKSLKRDRGR